MFWFNKAAMGDVNASLFAMQKNRKERFSLWRKQRILWLQKQNHSLG